MHLSSLVWYQKYICFNILVHYYSAPPFASHHLSAIHHPSPPPCPRSFPAHHNPSQLSSCRLCLCLSDLSMHFIRIIMFLGRPQWSCVYAPKAGILYHHNRLAPIFLTSMSHSPSPVTVLCPPHEHPSFPSIIRPITVCAALSSGTLYILTLPT